MGLDVYLYHCKDRKRTKAVEERYEKESEAIWAKHLNGQRYEQGTEAQKEAAERACDALKKKLGLVDYGSHPEAKKIELSSKTHPDHLFKVGYFRSSYNGGGINSYLERVGVPDLYEIMAPRNRYEFVPAWKACRARAADALGQLQALTNPDVDVMAIGTANIANWHRPPQNAEQARAIMEEELKRNTDEKGPLAMRAYSNAKGEFYLDGLEVIGMMHGTTRRLRLDEPCIWVAYRKKDEGKWYEQALEVVVETCDYVLAQSDPENYYVHWSS